jgi:hypothetical protein
MTEMTNGCIVFKVAVLGLSPQALKKYARRAPYILLTLCPLCPLWLKI